MRIPGFEKPQLAPLESPVTASSKPECSVSRLADPPLEPLAVIGIGCRLPGGLNSPKSLWDALLGGVDAICDVREDRWLHARFHDPDPEKVGCIRNARGGFVDGVDQFDVEFFGYFPTEAQRIDPQKRLLLESTARHSTRLLRNMSAERVWFRQDKPRAPGRGGRHCGFHQGGADGASRRRPAKPALSRAQS